MVICIITFGSRGDVQPYIALGLGLREAGYEVRICTHPGFEGFIRSCGLGFHPVQGNPTELMAGVQGERLQKANENPFKFAYRVSQMAGRMMEDLLKDSWEGSKDADAIIFSVTGWYAASHIMEKLGIPGVAAYLQPVNTTSEFPSFFAPRFIHKKGWINRFSYRLSQEIGWPYLRPFINAARRRVLNLSPMPVLSPFPRLERERAFPVLYGFSPTLLPKPFDWADNVEVCGFWFLPSRYAEQPTKRMVDFIQAGDPTIYLGFGSMRENNPRQAVEISISALQKVGFRGIILSNQTLEKLPEDILQVETISHEWLFPRIAMAVHHAGAGTCAAVLRAGIPSVAIPHFADQPLWADRLYRSGVSPKPILRKHLCVDRLAKAIDQVINDPHMRERSMVLGEKIRAEEGVSNAVASIQKILSSNSGSLSRAIRDK